MGDASVTTRFSKTPSYSSSLVKGFGRQTSIHFYALVRNEYRWRNAALNETSAWAEAIRIDQIMNKAIKLRNKDQSRVKTSATTSMKWQLKSPNTAQVNIEQSHSRAGYYRLLNFVYKSIIELTKWYRSVRKIVYMLINWMRNTLVSRS